MKYCKYQHLNNRLKYYSTNIFWYFQKIKIIEKKKNIRDFLGKNKGDLDNFSSYYGKDLKLLLIIFFNFIKIFLKFLTKIIINIRSMIISAITFKI